MHGARGHLILHKEEGANFLRGGFFVLSKKFLPSSLSLSTNPVVLYFCDAMRRPKRATLLFLGWGRGERGQGKGDDSKESPPYFRWICTEGSAAPGVNRRHFGSFFSSQGITFFPSYSNSFFPSYFAGSYRPPFCDVFSIPLSMPTPPVKRGCLPPLFYHARKSQGDS